MTTIKIDNKDYELESLSVEAQAQLFSLQATDAEIQRLNVLMAMTQTARNAYAKELATLLPDSAPKKKPNKSAK